MTLLPLVTQSSVVLKGLFNGWYEGSGLRSMNVMSWCSALGWRWRRSTRAFKGNQRFHNLHQTRRTLSRLCFLSALSSSLCLPYTPLSLRLCSALTAAVGFFSCLVFHFSCVIACGFVQSHPPQRSLQPTAALAQPPPLVSPRSDQV